MGTYKIQGMLHSNHNILEAKLNGVVLYSQNKKYVEYTVGGADEYIYEYENWLFPYINNSKTYYAEIYTIDKVYNYSPYNTPEEKVILLADSIEKIRIYYPDNITSISFYGMNWLREITYIYTDDSITVTYK